MQRKLVSAAFFVDLLLVIDLQNQFLMIKGSCQVINISLLWTHSGGTICKCASGGQKAKWPGLQDRAMSDI